MKGIVVGRIAKYIYLIKQGQEIIMHSKKKKTTITDITCQKDGMPMIDFKKEDFINLFTNNECHE